MEKEMIIKSEDGKDITISIVGEFRVEELDKEYIIYSIVDSDENNGMGGILIGEVDRDDDEVKVLGIKDDERNMVMAFYKEISNQVGEE